MMKAPWVWFPLGVGVLACSREAPPVAQSFPPTATSPALAASPTANAAPTATATAPPPRSTDASVTPALTLITGTYGSEWWVKTEGLPAISADGKRVAIINDIGDSMRGNANNFFLVVNVDDKVEKKLPLLVANELQDAKPTLVPRVEARLAAVRTELARTTWLPLTAVEATWHPESMTATSPAIDGADITHEKDRLRVRAQGKTLLDRDVRSWRVAPYDIPGFAPCHFEPVLETIALDPQRRAIAVKVTQVFAHDSCGFDNAVHVYRLAP